MAEIVIVDYEMGNLRSVQKALEHIGAEARITQDADEVARAERIVLPGVGAFRDAIAALRQRGLDAAVKDFIATGRPFLGICLGLQLLFDEGLEDGRYEGLGVLAGRCVSLPRDMTGPDGRLLKVPHMGWNQLDVARRSPILEGLVDPIEVYFVHTYVVEPEDPGVVATRTTYGAAFVSSVWRDNVMATQFHPEKSQRVGLRMLENFVNLK
ncbi:MAG: imidazole glycerol phosphate synthase subunit HisH [Planctomycetes bacterium]|nr:imidazole glycerol phosphate synthase subunit HisH [Planctomycetota bacterium]